MADHSPVNANSAFAWNTKDFADPERDSQESLESGSSRRKDKVLKYFAEILSDGEFFTSLTRRHFLGNSRNPKKVRQTKVI